MERLLLSSTPSSPRTLHGVLTRLILGGAIAATLTFSTGCDSNVEKYRKIGMAQYQKEQYDQSLDTFKKALHDDAFDAQSNAYSGMIYYREGKYVQAAYHFYTALQADPSLDDAKDGLINTYFKMGKPDQALDNLERAAETARTVSDPREAKGNLKGRYQKQPEERLFLGKVDDRIRIAHAYESLGDYDNALAYYNKALEMKRDSIEALMAAANLAEKAGNKVEAREYLRRAYLVDPSAKGLTDAMTRNGLAISEVIGSPKPKQ